MRAQHDQIDDGILARGDDLIGHPFANRLNLPHFHLARHARFMHPLSRPVAHLVADRAYRMEQRLRVEAGDERAR